MAGSVVGHGIANTMFGGRDNHDSAPAAAAPAAGTTNSFAQEQGPCGSFYKRMFLTCETHLTFTAIPLYPPMFPIHFLFYPSSIGSLFFLLMHFFPEFTDCLATNNNNISECQFQFDQFQSCKRGGTKGDTYA
jgi:hypothetical protein